MFSTLTWNYFEFFWKDTCKKIRVLTTTNFLMVYIKEQELLGIPFYYYFFTKTTEWKPFNMINNQITELILSTLPLFDLKIGERTGSGTN